MTRPTLRVFVDSNVIFSGAHTPDGTAGAVWAAAREGRFTVVLSQRVLDEVVTNLGRKSPEALNKLANWVESTGPELVPNSSLNEENAWFALGFGTDAAVAAAAANAELDYICTGDRRFRERLAATKGAPPGITPRDLLALLGMST